MGRHELSDAYGLALWTVESLDDVPLRGKTAHGHPRTENQP